MSTPPRAPRRARPDQPPAGLIRGIYVTWLGVVAGVIACTLVGLGWNFQRHPDGLPTEVIRVRPGITQTPVVEATSRLCANRPNGAFTCS